MAYWEDTGNDWRIRLNVNLSSQSLGLNQSILSWSLVLYSTIHQIDDPGYGSVGVNGSVWTMSPPTRIQLLAFNSNVTLASGNRTVTHDPDGSKTITVSAALRSNNQVQSWRIPQLSISNSMILPAIPRGPRVHDGTAYKHTVAYVHDGTGFKIATPYVNDGTSWKIGAN